MEVAAVFDFDKTLTFRDTLWPFMQFTHGQVLAYQKAAGKLPQLTGYTLGLRSRQSTKEMMLRAFYAGKSIEELKNEGQRFASGALNNHLRPEAIERLKWHQAQNHRCILVSASIDVYLEPWAKSMGFDEVITSRLQVESGLVTGFLEGKNCWGPEKARRLRESIHKLDNYTIYAYGDSRGDRELLELADHPFYRRFK